MCETFSMVGSANNPVTRIELVFADSVQAYLDAAAKLGDVKISVLEDESEARRALIEQEINKCRADYPDSPEDRATKVANAEWPESRVAEFFGPNAIRRVARVVLTGVHCYWDLYFMATKGYTDGICHVECVSSLGIVPR